MTLFQKAVFCVGAGVLIAFAAWFAAGPTLGETQISELTLAVQVVPGAGPVNGGRALSMTLGGVDEPPYGPLSFDLDGEDGFVVVDPLALRAVSVSTTGTVKEEWPIGFPADRVRCLDKNSILVRDAVSRGAFVVKRGGAVQRLDTPFPDDPLYRQPGGEAERHLLGLWRISESPLYVAAEFEDSSEAIRIRRLVRYLNTDGTVVQELDRFESDQFLPMEDDIRARGPHVAQLISGPGSLRIRRWLLPLD